MTEHNKKSAQPVELAAFKSISEHDDKRLAAVFSQGIMRIPHIRRFLPETVLHKVGRFHCSKPVFDRVIGWGLRPTTRRARAFAEKHRLPFITLEDGFLRSVGLGVAGSPPFALVYDDVGIYYDTSRPSRLETLILAADFDEQLLDNAQKAIDLMIEYDLSKYNHAPSFSQIKPHFQKGRPMVLVIDQTFGDMAVKYGGADSDSFRQMLDAAIAENPDADIWVKTHPDVVSGKKQGCLTDLQDYRNITVLSEDVSPLSLLKQVDKVYCFTSHMGFEALLSGKPVITFGLPWYAGWGVSDDRHPDVAQLQQTQRRNPTPLLHLFTAAYLQYSRYINPNSGEAGTIFDVIDYLVLAKQHNDYLRGDLYCVGVSLWKRAVISPFFNAPSCRLHFIRSIKQLAQITLPPQARMLVWGTGKDEYIRFAEQRRLPLLHIEDGFIRSVGLGSNLVAPLSLVIDDMGIYFNAQKASRLEYIIQNQCFSEKDIKMAKHLQQTVIAANIGKYNVGQGGIDMPPTDKNLILVPGQVEDDASIQFGSPQINSNLGLLQAVRHNCPDAYIVYKPHPDVLSGNRVGAVSDNDVLCYADSIVTDADILTCIQQVDEVHTMTSLTGFEALMRNKIVHCYGLPFYSNWGLTTDEIRLPRRTRRLNLLQLIAAALIYYPCYVDYRQRKMVDTATAIQLLQRVKNNKNKQLSRSWSAKQATKLKHLYLSLKIR